MSRCLPGGPVAQGGALTVGAGLVLLARGLAADNAAALAACVRTGPALRGVR
jgi:hypothetical protein